MSELSADQPQIMPNPAKDAFMLRLAQQQFANGKLVITSLDGRPMGTFAIHKTETRIDISNFSKGVYLLEITVDDTRFIRRLIKH